MASGMSWTIHVCKDCGQRAHYQDRCPKGRRCVWTEMVEVPVVPCDDAAIERGAEALIAIAARWGLGEWHIEGARELAEAVLRAAGEAT
jgi:hypothetical protein